MDPKNLDLKQTLNLPRTSFDMKANLPVAEPKRLAEWDEEKRLLERDFIPAGAIPVVRVRGNVSRAGRLTDDRNGGPPDQACYGLI